MSYAKSMYKKPAAQSGVVYKVGDTVLHKVFGRGMVMKTEKMGNDTLLEIAFDKAGTKNLMAGFLLYSVFWGWLNICKTKIML